MSSVLSFLRRIARRSRTVVGLALILTSVIGVVLVVRGSAPGERVILAATFVPAGTVITNELIVEGRASVGSSVTDFTTNDVVGKVLGVDWGEGEVLSARMLEPASTERVVVAVPLGVSPPTSIAPGKIVDVWAVDTEGIEPPLTVAHSAVVDSIVESGFGGDTMMTLRVDVTSVDRLLAFVGTSFALVVTTGDTP
jgi:hypothetical protein